LGGRSDYDEAWLQNLLHENPDVLPMEQIEPGFGRLIPVCKELPLTFGAGKSGSLDNLFVTRGGGLFLTEAKLWRNPEARRSVVAQAMEYAAALFRLNYDGLESAIQRARNDSTRSLFQIVSDAEHDVNEVEFIDAVSRNLSRGRAIISVVGDGIREDIAPLAELLQTHAGHRFTFVLIELAVYETPQNNVKLVAPSVLAQTALIERGVVQIVESADGRQRIVVEDPQRDFAKPTNDRSFGIGEDEFYDLLDQRNPGLADLLKTFLAKAEGLGVYADRQGALNLKHASPKGNPLNLATIDKSGFVETAPSSWWNRKVMSRRYNETLAALIGGTVRDVKHGQELALRTDNGKTPRLSQLLPLHEEAWLKAIERYIKDAFDEAASG
jgi:hypothetical protein